MSDTPLVLVVEDDIDLQELLAFTFETHGFDVVVRDDGAEALEYLRRGDDPPAVVLLDLLMPDVDGLEFLRRRRGGTNGEGTGESETEIPVVVLTALDDEETLAEAFELGAVDYVTKPFSPNALVTRVNRLL